MRSARPRLFWNFQKFILSCVDYSTTLEAFVDLVAGFSHISSLLAHFESITPTAMDVLISQQALKVPEHLNRQLFEKAIRSYEKDSSAKVLDFSVSSGANAGDNFGSQIFRVKIKFSSKYRKEAEISTIVKTIEKTFNLAGLSDFDKQKTAFVIEAEIYGKILPDMKDLLKESFWPG